MPECFMNEEMCNSLHEEVTGLLSRYTGGTEFFNMLDAAVRHRNYFNCLLGMADSTNTQQINIEGVAVSGWFGMEFAAWLRSSIHNRPLLIFPGDLRHHPELAIPPRGILNHSFVFIDDSMYKGRTFAAVKRSIETSGGVCNRAIVAYDGCKEEHSNVHSMYRYWEHHGDETQRS